MTLFGKEKPEIQRFFVDIVEYLSVLFSLSYSLCNFYKGYFEVLSTVQHCKKYSSLSVAPVY